MHRRAFIAAGAAGAAAATTPAWGAGRFYVPAEEHPHELCLMMWPVSREVYGDAGFLQAVQETIADIANTIAEFEPVVMLADVQHHRAAERLLSEQVALWNIPTEDLWARDAGPIFAIDGAGARQVRHIRFNGWGARQVHEHDGKVAERVARKMGVPVVPSPLQGEAGGVEQDGHGLLMAHESSWVHEGRNPGMTREQIGAALLEAYGAERMIWTPGLKDQDITDYHIDSLARFTGPGRVLMTLPDAPDMRDPFHRAAVQTHDMLEAEGLEIVVIPEPEFRRVEAEDFVASYANYYVANGAVISARFGDPDTDAIAFDALAKHYPGREIVQVNADALGEIGGGIHCATHEVPMSGRGA